MPERPCPVYIAKGKDRSAWIELFANIRCKGDRPAVGFDESGSHVCARTLDRFCTSHGFHMIFERGGGGTDRCKFSRNKRNQRFSERNLDSKQNARAKLARDINLFCSTRFSLRFKIFILLFPNKLHNFLYKNYNSFFF